MSLRPRIPSSRRMTAFLEFSPITGRWRIPISAWRRCQQKENSSWHVEDSFDPYAYFIAGAFAGFGQTKDDPKSWGEESWGPYIKRYAASFADQTSENIMTEAVVPSLLRKTLAIFVSELAAFSNARVCCSRIWVTQTDAGHRTFNFSEIMGAGASAGISNIYYPRENGHVRNLSQWGVMVEKTRFSICSRNTGPIFASKCLRDSIRPIRIFPLGQPASLRASYGLGQKRTKPWRFLHMVTWGRVYVCCSMPGPSLLLHSDELR